MVFSNKRGACGACGASGGKSLKFFENRKVKTRFVFSILYFRGDRELFTPQPPRTSLKKN
jgi:hypothetical protein